MTRTSTKLKVLATVGGAAAAVSLSVTPAFASGTDTGNETITSPVTGVPGKTNPSFTVTNDANGNPISEINITGTGWSYPGQVYAMICDGVPETSSKWNIGVDCDTGTATGGLPVGSNVDTGGQFSNLNSIEFFADQAAQGYGSAFLFRGESPNDQFNCLAPGDNPNSTSVNVPNAQASAPTTPAIPGAASESQYNSSTLAYPLATIDPTVPSWGASTVGANGGGTAPCQIRIAYSDQTVDKTSDVEIPFVIPTNGVPIATTPPPSTPESPLAIALPVGGVALFGLAGVILYRKRRPGAAA